MLKFKLTCPDCGTAVITSFPEAMVWERCPSCRNHSWDQYDVLMADACHSGSPTSCGQSAHAYN